MTTATRTYTTTDTVTDTQIRQLRAEALAAGDEAMVATCDRALGESCLSAHERQEVTALWSREPHLTPAEYRMLRAYELRMRTLGTDDPSQADRNRCAAAIQAAEMRSGDYPPVYGIAYGPTDDTSVVECGTLADAEQAARVTLSDGLDVDVVRLGGAGACVDADGEIIADTHAPVETIHAYRASGRACRG